MTLPDQLPEIESLLRHAAADSRTFSYSELLQTLGHRFTRPRMRALCKLLDTIDARAAAAGQPELAALVVRESDRLPGQGWWTGRHDHAGAWTGAPARAYLAPIHAAAFAYWRDHSNSPKA